MTPEQWDEICEWVEDRYTKPWPLDMQIAFFTDLEDFDASDVWSALFHLYESGSKFTPTGSELLSRTLYERRQAARADVYRGLPEPRGTPYVPNEAKKDTETGIERITRIHKQKGPCKTLTCDVCHEQKEEQNGRQNNDAVVSR